MSQITASEAAAYLARWAHLNRQEVADLRKSPVEQKFRQLCALAASREIFPEIAHRDSDAAGVAARWRQIRAFYGD